MSVTTYQRLVIWLAVGLLFSNFSYFLLAKGLTGIPPLYPIVLVVALTLPLALRPGRLAAVLSAPGFAWSCAYFALSALAFLLSSRSPVAQQELRIRVLSCLMLTAFLLLLSDETAARTARRAMLVSTLVLGVGLNLFEVFRPLTFSESFGRSAGFYLNPNLSATVIVAAGLLTLNEVAENWRPLVVTLLTLAILATLSRSNIVAWIPLLPLLVFTGMVRGKSLLLALGLTVGLAAAVLIPSGLLEAAWEVYQRSSSEALARIATPFQTGINAEESTGVRLEALVLALKVFGEHPFLGAGLGATWEWAYSSRPHNMYATLLAEQGILGGLIYPAAIAAIALHSREWRRGVELASIFLLWSGLFSHNMLEPPALLMLFALTGRRVASEALASGTARTGLRFELTSPSILPTSGT